jgi:hypothetical protein
MMTHLPVLALNSWSVSSSAAVITNSPLSSNDKLVNDFPSSLCLRNTREGLNELYGCVRRQRVARRGGGRGDTHHEFRREWEGAGEHGRVMRARSGRYHVGHPWE